MSVLSGLSPKKVFEFFELICSVPHGSGNTKIISDLCVDFAKERSLSYYQDSLNNVLIKKGASKGYEGSAPIILQGHIDMVLAKEEGYEKDMEREGIDLILDGDRIRADRTSLGGDNGVAIAIIMAILDDDTLEHPPIEALFTVDEETGMDGAQGFDYSLLSGKRLINLDSEEEGVFTAGCAGGARVNCTLPVMREKAEGLDHIDISVSGLLSGHSGVDIDKGRASATLLIARLLYRAIEKMPLRLCSYEGGTLDNVIPKKALATVALPREYTDAFFTLIEEYKSIFANEYASADPDICLSATLANETEIAPLTVSDTEKLLTLIMMLPSGVQEMSMDIKGLVQTSLNLGVLKLCDKSLDFSFSVRSCITTAKEELIRRVCGIVSYMGGDSSVHGEYPAWEFAKVSYLRETTLAAYKALTGKDGIVSATHGGLECGLFTNKIEGLDCISFGPDLCDVHSVRESLSASSTKRLYELCIEVLKMCK